MGRLKMLNMAQVAEMMQLPEPDSRSSRLKAIYFIRKKQRKMGKEFLTPVGRELQIPEVSLEYLLVGNVKDTSQHEDTIAENKYQIEQLQKEISKLRRRISRLEREK